MISVTVLLSIMIKHKKDGNLNSTAVWRVSEAGLGDIACHVIATELWLG